MAVHTWRAGLVEFVLGLSNNLLERSTLEYYLGDLIQNSEFQKVIQH
jgi:hypothetical protein